mmetsp:Transcript_5074/g.7355  ORF Transcript_5074/g.7355 Transcript_5074/m.7355 type:complete len:310 (-) Transcript_5074:136-1065(-)|eukprot:CAMPEP_0194217050 /NCGR_PEP_ID=MMETSP0156-20130528/20207_1 /TAXON_ID=33649 /ORGANISM="Thalassionema nitzschioides, Strain L26-B" /LENGTH=309 /DNA_ID=CAMNT_0038945969 /DNA_START=186 /DNA_END=1115 /DNA_ORIENTATION=-
MLSSKLLTPYQLYFRRKKHSLKDVFTVLAFTFWPFPTLHTSVNVGRRTLRLQQWPGRIVGSGGFVWHGARRLVKHFESFGDGCAASEDGTQIGIKGRKWKGLNVIELGAGTGAAGLAAAALGADVTLTDQASYIYPNGKTQAIVQEEDTKSTSFKEKCSLIDLLKINVKISGAVSQSASNRKPKVAELLWGNTSLTTALPLSTYDLICGSDILLFAAAHVDLITTIRTLSNSDTVVLIEHTDREGGDADSYPRDMLHFLALIAEEKFWIPSIVKDHGRHITLRMTARKGTQEPFVALPARCSQKTINNR